MPLEVERSIAMGDRGAGRGEGERFDSERERKNHQYKL